MRSIKRVVLDITKNTILMHNLVISADFPRYRSQIIPPIRLAKMFARLLRWNAATSTCNGITVVGIVTNVR